MTKQTYMQSLEALGTHIELRLVADSKQAVEQQFQSLWDEVRSFEKRFSRFDPESELTQINQTAGAAVPISKEMYDLFILSKNYNTLTNGHFNPLSLPAVQRAGYIQSLVNDFAPLDYTSRRVCSMDEVSISTGTLTMPYDCAFDFGGIGKGYLADRLGHFLDDSSYTNYCLSIGGDILAHGKDADNTAWKVYIQSAQDRSLDIATHTCNKSTAGIATSGYTRIYNNVTQEHIISDQKPMVGKIFSMCTVVADSATDADVFATYVLTFGTPAAKKLFNEKRVQSVFLQGVSEQENFILGNGIVLLNNSNIKAYE